MRGIDAVLLTSQDPWGPSRGGTVTFAKHLLRAYAARLAVASMCEGDLPEGLWVDRWLGEQNISFFSIGSVPQGSLCRKPIVPARVTVHRRFAKYMERIRALGVRNVLIDSPNALFAASRYRWNHLCYRFAGVNNAAANSRYRIVRCFSRQFERRMVAALQAATPDTILASASQQAIGAFLARIDHSLPEERIHAFPTRVDTGMFFPEPRETARGLLGLSLEDTIVTSVGRLCWVKGWDLLLDAASVLRERIPRLRIVFVGDGADREKLLRRARRLGMKDAVVVTGFVPHSVVRQYINAADLCVVGSYQEGWSLAMCEILACGRPLVSTDVSGARELIRDGQNGFVVASRDVALYAQAVESALGLSFAAKTSLEIADAYSVAHLARDLGGLWAPLAI